jgi:hypothetical protein
MPQEYEDDNNDDEEEEEEESSDDDFQGFERSVRFYKLRIFFF